MTICFNINGRLYSQENINFNKTILLILHYFCKSPLEHDPSTRTPKIVIVLCTPR